MLMRKYIFKNYGGSYQLNIEKPEELQKILDLDEALWAATSIPVEILNTDKRFLSYLDADKNGRIRTDELKSAVKWLLAVLKNYSRLTEKGDALFLGDINTGGPEGKTIKETAEIVLSNLNIPDTEKITLSSVRNIQGIMASSATNGDGVITPEDTDDHELSGLIRAIMATTGTTPDAGGKNGVSGSQINTFFSGAENYLAWLEKGRVAKGEEKTGIMVWGKEDTPRAFTVISAVEEKIDEFFALCDIYRFDNRIKESLKLTDRELEEMDLTDRNLLVSRLKKAPVAEINEKGILDLSGKTNQAYREDLKNLSEKILVKVFGREVKELSREDWGKVKNIFVNYKAYMAEKKDAGMEGIPEEKLKRYTEKSFRLKLNELVEKDLAVAEKIKHIQDVEKLILYQKYLVEFANNSASFANVYNPDVRSLFEAGTLVIDGRKLTLTIRTSDRALHKKIAQNSNVYLLYLEITSKHDTDSKFEVVAAVTSGDSGRLRLGKRGIFFTRDNREWDAEVIDIAVNPIGLLESIKAPFIKLSDSIKNQVEKIAKSREAKIETTVMSPTGTGMARDLMVGGGVALAALGSSFAYITKALSQVKFLHVLTTIGLILLAILLPGLIIGIIKLRRRDLSILFEASGCAINVKMKLTVNLGRIFTFIPPYPPGSYRQKIDIIPEFAQKARLSKNFSIKRLLITALITILSCSLAFLAFMLLFFE